MGSSTAQPLMLMQQLTMCSLWSRLSWKTSEEVVQTHQHVAFFVYDQCGANPHPLCHLYGRRLVPLGGGTREAANARLPGLLWQIWIAALCLLALCFWPPKAQMLIIITGIVHVTNDTHHFCVSEYINGALFVSICWHAETKRVSPWDEQHRRNDKGQQSRSQDDGNNHHGQQRACEHTSKRVKRCNTGGSCRGNRHSPSLQLKPFSKNPHLKEAPAGFHYRQWHTVKFTS